MKTFAILGAALAALTAPLAHAQQPYIGEVREFAFDYCPTGWAATNGATLQITSNPALFSLLGTKYGGDGRSTFALPSITAPSTTAAAAAPAPTQGGEARVYQDCNKEGWSYPLGLGDYRASDFRAPYSDNNVSSVTASPGWQVTLFDGPNFDGESVTVANEACLVGRNFNDRTSSLRVTRVATPAIASPAKTTTCIAVQGAFPARP